MTESRPQDEAEARPTARRRRPLLVLLALIVLTFPTWWLLKPHVVRRELALTATTSREVAGHWAVEWTPAGSDTRHGLWIDPGRGAPDLDTVTLEIRPQGQTPAGGAAELWLHSLASTARPDVPFPLENLPNDEQAEIVGDWSLLEPDLGIVFRGDTPGLLKFPVDGTGMQLVVGRTPRGGPVELRYGGATQTIDTFAAHTDTMTVRLDARPAADGVPLYLRCKLPNYALAKMHLRFVDAPGNEYYLPHPRITDHVFGVRVKDYATEMEPLENVERVYQHVDGRAFRTIADTGALKFNAPRPLGRTGHFVGLAFSFLVVAGGAALLGLIMRAPLSEWLACLPMDAIAIVVVVVAHLAVAAWAVPLISPDGLGYLVNAQQLWETGSFAHIGDVWMPGYSVFLVPFVGMLTDFIRLVEWTQVGLAIATALLVWGVLRRLLPAPWSWLGLLLVGLDPLLIAYSHFILTETLAAFLVIAACYCTLRAVAARSEQSPRFWPALGLAVVIGVIAAAASHVRANLQLLYVLLPLTLLLAGWRRWGAGRSVVLAVASFAVAIAGILPWSFYNQQRYGKFGMGVVQHYSAFLNAWNNDSLEVNQTAVLDYAQWHDLDERIRADAVRQYDVYLALQAGSGAARDATRHPWLASEALCGEILEESHARRPDAESYGMWRAFATQLGLWTGFTQVKSTETVRAIGTFTGQRGPDDNLLIRDPEDPDGREARMARRIAIDRTHVREQPLADAFAQWYALCRAGRPVVAVLFLFGFCAALRQRHWLVLGLGAIPLANAVALAVLVGSAIDRYKIPFVPLIALVAVYGAGQLIRWVCCRMQAAESPRAAEAPPTQS
jgi:hypothetical protein